MRRRFITKENMRADLERRPLVTKEARTSNTLHKAEEQNAFVRKSRCIESARSGTALKRKDRKRMKPVTIRQAEVEKSHYS